jgi:hypothetical protein
VEISWKKFRPFFKQASSTIAPRISMACTIFNLPKHWRRAFT